MFDFKDNKSYSDDFSIYLKLSDIYFVLLKSYKLIFKSNPME
jgi:hypothetical protein